MGNTSSGRTKGEDADRKRRKDHVDLLYRKGVLIPPQFGTATDTPPPSSFYGGDFSFISGSVLSSRLSRISSVRLLSSEHLLKGLFVSTSTGDGLGNVAAGWSVGPLAGEVGEAGFLSGTLLLPANCGASSHSRGSIAALSGIGGTVVTRSCISPDSSASASELVGQAGTFMLRPLGSSGGHLEGYAYVAGLEREQNGGHPSPEDFIKSEDGGDCLSQESASAKIGWNYSRLLEASSTSDADGGGSVQYYRNNPFISKQEEKKEREQASAVRLSIGSSLCLTPKTGLNADIKEVSSHIALSGPASEGAIEAVIPISMRGSSILNSFTVTDLIKKSYPDISGYLSFDLNQAGAGASTLGDRVPKECKGPPIVVTLQSLRKDRSSVAAATVSQAFTFDRIVTNPMEERCPKIRNTVSWAVQLKRSIGSRRFCSGLSPMQSRSTVGTSFTAAFAWQVNRGLCYKAHVDSKSGLTLGILLKRWAHPRLTASLLFGTGGSSPETTAPLSAMPGSIGIKGICLQVESGSLPSAPAIPLGTVSATRVLRGDWLYGIAGQAGGNIDSGDGPATKAELSA